ncbi:uncharacterized protein LOC107431853 [Ziziphus jujuba]|uniref:Uncharacterized protein LOC107431853 n=1 Tax=Ziziphus jujuba TaxID=326968 RepID=A0A6P4BH26_ZIZJJ|nr:uncharacterized protein LOC107431853 [Ziziphus jujuba]XP_015898352.2 uncharacterized protein LOC107431853 [Ziziphus jujuba]XP_015898353.2 uncharacterized protein LOC107431853 [Ziziphus jujuba]XP_060668573.1 uncharacterized protein LOC107431853 [Ziziphus jujuba]
MEGSSRSNSNEWRGSIKDNSWFSQFRNGSNPWMARYVYALMFLLANLLAWAVRDYGRSALTEVQRLEGCQGAKDCLGAEGVLRVSLGCCTFYFTMFLTTAGTSKLNEPRDSWQSGWWFAKIVLWVAFTIIPFLLPSAAIQLYGDVAHFGAGVFLLIQLISVISFITWLNDWCQSEKHAERCQIQAMLVATTAYVVCIVGIIMMYIWYAPEPSCLLNIFFITWTLVLLQLMTSVSLHPKVNAGILTPGLMGLYIVFICWCAIRSEPAGENCNMKAEASNKTDWLTIISFVVAVLAMVIATFSTGIDSQCFQFRKDKIVSEDDVPYGYGFFHFVFATGAMYFAMLLIGWNTHHAMKKWTIDVGWTSTWVRVVNEWLAVCVYLWMLVAPIIWKSSQTSDNTSQV